MLLQWDLTKQEQHEKYIEISELEFSKRIRYVVSYLATVKSLKILTIAGPTSSGKTTTAEIISKRLFEEHGISSKMISLDNFYKNTRDIVLKKDGKPNFEVIDAIDVDMILKCMRDIIEKNSTTIPIFDFKTGKRKEEGEYISTGEHEIIILEGIHGLNPAIVDSIPEQNYKSIYITVAERVYMPDGTVVSKRDVRFLRRLIRDFKHRNASPELTFELWETVCEGEDLYIFPYEYNADLQINSLHAYEICVVKHQAIELLQQMDKTSKYYPKACELIEKLNCVPSISEDLVPENSLLREFI